jgi:septal ring factor EnvC (AmiA/AmiB activator)
VSEKIWQEAVANRQNVENILEKLREQIGELETSQQEIRTEIAYQQTDEARLRAQLDVLEQAEKALTGYASGAKLLLQAAHQDA